MSITLTRGTTTLTLPDDLLWVDEFGWQPVEQRVSYTITGAVIVEAAAKQAGRPISLEGGDDYGWVQRSVIATLDAWKALPAEPLTLVLRGTTYNVAFDHERGALETRPVMEVHDPDPTDYYVLRLRFLEL